MSELRDRIRQALEREDPPPGRLETTLARVRRHERRRRVASGAVAFAMFGAVVAGVWLGARSIDRAPAGEEPTPTPSVTTPPHRLEISPVARVTCEEGRTIAVDRSVDALADGVHFSVTNRTDEPVVFGGGGRLGPGATDEFILQVEPGGTIIACHPASRADANELEVIFVQVNDPRGYWVSGEIDCAGMTAIPFGAGAGFAGTPEEVVREHWEHRGLIQPTDEVRRGGYPESAARSVVVIRDGAPGASVNVSPTEGGRWHITGWKTCDSFVRGEPPGESEQSAPSTARLVCEEGRTVVLDEEVAAQPDGVHFLVENPRDEYVEFVERFGLGPGQILEFVYPVEPGLQTIHCYNINRQSQPLDSEYADVMVVDPEGLWVDPSLECQPGGFIAEGIRDFLDFSHGVPGSPEDAVRADEEFEGRIEDGDVVRRAGYPQSEDASVIVERDGTTIAAIPVERADDGGWIVTGSSACSDAF